MEETRGAADPEPDSKEKGHPMASNWTLLFAAVAGLFVAPALAGEIDFAETFAIAEDRAAVLDRLSPGTEEYYYFHCLYAQHQGDAAAFEEIMARWIGRLGETEGNRRLRNRQALLAYERTPGESLTHIRRVQGLSFDHAPPGETVGGEDPPTTLDPAAVDPDRLLAEVLRRPDPVSAMTDAGLPLLPADRLNPDGRRKLLDRLAHPDHPALAALARAELERGESYERLPGRHLLLREDMDALRAAVPALEQSPHFVHDYLRRLTPSADVSTADDPAALRDWLERAETFLASLPEIHAPLRARFLHRLLELDRREGRRDPRRFLAYLRLPGTADYLRPERRQRFPSAPVPDFPGLSDADPAVSDEALVRDYLFHFFETAESPAPYDRYIREDWLGPLFAEVKLTRGVGDPERWIPMLSPAQYAAIRDRAVLEFAPDRPRRLAADAPVILPVEIKNVGTLSVRIYALDPFNHYRRHGREIFPDIDLDGLSATRERVHRYQEPPLRRVRRQLEFPELSEPGIYVVDLIGGGLRSRAVIRKGHLHAVRETGPAGPEFRVFDETGRHRPDAVLWLDGRTYEADAEGTIIVPFSTAPGPRRAVLRAFDGSAARCALLPFFHEAESYALSAGFHLVRETLLRGLVARVLLRPRLTLNGTPVALSLLEDASLTVVLTDAEGVETRETVDDIEPADDREILHDFAVPENLVRVGLELVARVRVESTGETTRLTDRRTFAAGGIDAAEATADLFLRRTAEGYSIDFRGRNGEARPGRNLRVRLHHRLFREPVARVLRTDERGRASLGPLPGILRVEADPGDGPSRNWPLSEPRERRAPARPGTIHARAGDPIRLPWHGIPDATPPPVRLLEIRGDVFLADRTDAVGHEPGFLVLEGLSGGDYDLFLRDEDAKIRIRVAEGEFRDGRIFGAGRVLEAPALPPLGFVSVEIGPGEIAARLAGAGPFTRVHAIATRFVPEFDAAADLDHPAPPPDETRLAAPESAYVSGETVSDEYRYILDRQYAARHPGNMLDRPELLLHPRAVRETDRPEPEPRGLYEERAAADMAEARMFGAAPSGEVHPAAAPRPPEIGANFDFLAETAMVLPNLRPDADGRVSVDRGLLGDRVLVRFVAADPLQVASRTVALPSAEPARRDLRLDAPLPGDRGLIRRDRATAVPAGETFAIADPATARYARYGDVKTAFRLLRNLCEDPELDEFAFLGDWADISDAERKRRYADFASHEMNFFLYFKDPDFFERVAAPMLRQKLEPGFLDLWMLDADLSAFEDPAAFERLTLTERILLLERGPGGPDRARRYVEDILELHPPDPETRDRLFAAALRTQGAAPDAPPRPAPPPAPEPAMALPMAPMASEMVEAPGAPGPDSEPRKRAFFRDRKVERRDRRPLYRALPTTREWAESDFWKIPPGESPADRVSIHPFWRDFAARTPGTPFLSPRFPYAHATRTEVLFALAVLDLPFSAEEPRRRTEGGSLHLSAPGSWIVFHRELHPGSPDGRVLPILLSQDFFRSDDRYRYEGSLRLDKFVDGAFEARVAYGGQVVVGNPTSARLRLDLLLQIPQGAMPLRNGFRTRNLSLELSPFETRRVEYGFYFPEPGNFRGFPAHVSREETLLAKAEAAEFRVVPREEAPKRDGWTEIARSGDDRAVLAALRERNPARIRPADIAFRMKDRDFFRAVLDVLRERVTYDPTLWSYGVFHDDPRAIREYLSRSNLAEHCGPVLDSPLLVLDPVRRGLYAHLEYRPLVNARVHRSVHRSGPPTIADPDVFEQYERFLDKLVHTPRPAGEDLLEAVYYLLLQDRVGEAGAVFERIDADSLRPRMQYDYARVYLDISNRRLDRARETAAAYADHPALRWRDRFRNALAQLDEIAGTVRDPVDSDEDRERIQERLADTDPILDLRLEGAEIVLTHRNLDACELRFYPVDVELLFSRDPFRPGRPGQLPPVRPERTERIVLEGGAGEIRVPVPDPLRAANLIVEASAAGLSRSEIRYANDLDVALAESYGHLRVAVRATGEPVPAAYVKVYAEIAGDGVRFYKDGYTDLRGRFDYLSLGSDLIDRTNRLALLVLTEEHGAVIREVRPPGR
jgi:hypothetical protein